MLVARRLADDARGRNHTLSAGRFEERVRDTHQRAELIRQVLLDGRGGRGGATLDQLAAAGPVGGQKATYTAPGRAQVASD